MSTEKLASRPSQDRVLSVIMPAYNEASSIESVIRKVLEQPEVAELIVVDDATWDVRRKLSASHVPSATSNSPGPPVSSFTSPSSSPSSFPLLLNTEP